MERLLIEQEVCMITGMSERQYAELKYQQGLKYLRHIYANDPAKAFRMERSRAFWKGWWEEVYLEQDRRFLDLAYCQYPMPNRLAVYLETHDVSRIRWVPNWSIDEMAFDELHQYQQSMRRAA